jgi:hypothetical protein
MAALPPVPKVLQVRLSGSYGTAEWMNGFYLQYAGGPPTQADLDTFAAVIDSDWASTVATRLSINTQIKLVELVDLDNIDGLSAAQASTTGGSISGTAAPANVAACVSFKQSRRYRGGHPRNYVVGIPQVHMASETKLADAAATALAGQYLAFRALLHAHSYTSLGALKWVAVSRYLGSTYDEKHHRIPTPRPTPLIRDVSSFVCNTRLDSQRRRLGA